MAETRPHHAERPFLPCIEGDRAWAGRAPYRSTATVDLPVSPEQLFAILEDPATWPEWAVGIGQVEWTSAKPYGPGTTRTVTFLDGTAVYEHFFEWQPPQRLGFTFYGATQAIFEGFVELYEISPTAEGCELAWTVAYAPAGHFRWLHPWIRPAMRLAFAWYLRRLRRLCARSTG